MGVPHRTATIYIETKLYNRVAEFNKKERRSISFSVARALEMYLAMREVESDKGKSTMISNPVVS
jgi:predicted transcriptional regulator